MKKVRYITDAAMITAIMAVFLLISNLTSGILISNLAFILPVPVTIYGLRYDWKKAIIPAFASFIVGLIINFLIGLLYILPASLVSIIYVIVLNKKELKIGYKIGIMFIGSFIVNILTTVIFSKVLFGYTIIEDTIALSTSLIDSISGLIKISDSVAETIKILMVSAIPAIIVVNSLIECILCYFVISIIAEKMLKKNLGTVVLSLNIAVPKLVTYVLTPISLISLFFVNKLSNYETFGIIQILVTIGLNIVVILSLAYIIESLVLLSLFYSKLHKRYLVIVSIAILIFMPFLHVIIGFMDSIFNFRYRLLKK